MKKIILKKILTDQTKNFFLGHCIYIDGIMVYTGDKEATPISIDESFEYTYQDENSIQSIIKKLPEGKTLEKPALARMIKISKKNKQFMCNNETDKQ